MKKICCLILVLTLIILSMSSCTSEREDQCRLVAEDFLTKYQQLDPSAGVYVSEYVNNEQIQYSGIQALIAERISYEIKGSEELENGCAVTVVISAPDFQAVFNEVAEEFMETDTEENVVSNLASKLDAPNVSMRSFTVEFYISVVDDSYQIEMTSEISNALSGGYYEYIDSLVEGMLNG